MPRDRNAVAAFILAFALPLAAASGSSPAAGKRATSTAKPTARLAFGYGNAGGTALLTATMPGDATSIKQPEQFDTAVCSGNVVVAVSFQGYQKSGPRDDGRAWAEGFDEHQGYRFQVIKGRPQPDASCLLTTEDFLAGKRIAPVKEDTHGVPCNPEIVSRLAGVEGRAVHFCRRFATVGADGELFAVEFERRGDDLLAGIVLKIGGELLVREMPARYDEASHSGWRVGDEGHLVDDAQDPSALDREVVNVFKPLFALVGESAGAMDLGIEWAGEEGLSLMLLSSSGGKLLEVANGYRYTAPR